MRNKKLKMHSNNQISLLYAILPPFYRKSLIKFYVNVFCLFYVIDAHFVHTCLHCKACVRVAQISKTIFMAVSILGHNGHYGYFSFMAIMARINMAINMAFMGVFSKYNKNADQQPKRFLKICFN